MIPFTSARFQLLLENQHSDVFEKMQEICEHRFFEYGVNLFLLGNAVLVGFEAIGGTDSILSLEIVINLIFTLEASFFL